MKIIQKHKSSRLYVCEHELFCTNTGHSSQANVYLNTEPEVTRGIKRPQDQKINTITQILVPNTKLINNKIRKIY